MSKLQREKAGGKQIKQKAKQSGPKCLEAGEAILLSASNPAPCQKTSNIAVASRQATEPRSYSISALLSGSDKQHSGQANITNQSSLIRCHSRSGLLNASLTSHGGKASTTGQSSKPSLTRCHSSSDQCKSSDDLPEIHLGDKSISINGSGLQLAIRRHSSTKTETSPNEDCKASSR